MKILEPVIVIGSGGHAKVLIDLLRSSGNEILFCTEADPSLVGSSVLGVPIAGPDEMIDDYSPGDVALVNGLGSVGIPELRRRITERWLARGFKFATLVHPTAVVSSTAVVETGAQIMAGVIIQTAATIGPGTIVNTRASIDHDCVVGAHSHIAPGVTLSGQVSIGETCHVGTGAQIIQGVSIGTRVLVAAGATVINSVPDSTVVAGTPAKPISKKTPIVGGTLE